MEQEDYIKRQIDQLGRVLGKILADLTGLQTGGQTSEGIEAAGQALKGELALDIDDLISIHAEEFVITLQTGRKMSNDNFEKLADILFLLAGAHENKEADGPKKEKLYERALIIFRHLDESSLTYSFDRHNKIVKIKNLLQT